MGQINEKCKRDSHKFCICHSREMYPKRWLCLHHGECFRKFYKSRRLQVMIMIHLAMKLGLSSWKIAHKPNYNIVLVHSTLSQETTKICNQKPIIYNELIFFISKQNQSRHNLLRVSYAWGCPVYICLYTYFLHISIWN